MPLGLVLSREETCEPGAFHPHAFLQSRTRAHMILLVCVSGAVSVMCPRPCAARDVFASSYVLASFFHTCRIQ